MEQTPARRDVAILVVSCDRYQDLWRPFFRCFFKYWPDCPYPVYLGSNRATYSDPRVRPLLVGDDVDYSSNLLSMLAVIPHDWVILWIEDRVLSAPVSTERLAALIRGAQEQDAAYLKLLATHPFAIPDVPSRDFGELPRGTAYRVCITLALWNKFELLHLLRRGETAWELERNGTKRSNVCRRRFFALYRRSRHDPPISDEHMIIKGRLIRDARAFIEREGLMSEVQHRQLQSFASHWYVKAYTAALDLKAEVTSRLISLSHLIWSRPTEP